MAQGQPKAAYQEREVVLTSTDRLCFTCPLADCVGEGNKRCPIWQERHMLRMLKRRKEASAVAATPPTPVKPSDGCSRCGRPIRTPGYRNCDRCRAIARRSAQARALAAAIGACQEVS